MNYRDETEPSHYPHMERLLRPLTVINGTQRTTWFPRRMDLPQIENEAAAQEGGTFREPAPARIPRARPLFGSKPESTPLTATESASFWGVTLVCVVIFGSALALWAIKTWG